MKKFAFLILGLFCLAAVSYAQDSTADYLLKRKGAYLTQNGVRLPELTKYQILSDVGGRNLNLKWDAAAKDRKAGLALLPVSAGCAFMTMANFIMYSFSISPPEDIPEYQDLMYRTSAWVGLIGTYGFAFATVTSLAGGVILIAIGCSNMNRVVRQVNSYRSATSNGATLSLGPTPGGIGLSLVF